MTPSAQEQNPTATAPGVDPVHPFSIVPSESGLGSFPPLGSNVNALMVWPRFPPSFWGFEGVLEMIPEQAMTPPLGLMTVAALCPATWNIHLIDRAVEELRDEDLRWADLVMVSAMHAQRADAVAVLARARSLGRRTFIGGPWASSEPELLLLQADHVLAGEAEEVFADIAAALERGTARRLYRVSDKPDMTRSPVPRYDLIRLDKYKSMPVQFSRGCPFQCEFCDIITIYGRRPRTKTTAQLIEELNTLRRLGWRDQVFIVDDNFIGNYRQALLLARDLTVWQQRNERPFSFYTEASIDLADRPELLAAMVEANFMCVFIGIETPSGEALRESRKFQNLRSNNVQQIRVIQEAGLWVLGGFIVGFDSDDESIFSRQLEFIERTAIAWAMVGVLQAPPTTALYDRMKKEGRLIENSQPTSNFSAPNFRTMLPLPVLLRGFSTLLTGLYEPESFFERAFRSLEAWRPRGQRPPKLPVSYNLRVLFASFWRQGVRSSYRRAYWRFLWLMAWNWAGQPAKMWLGFMVLLSAHHFVIYARQVADELEQECRARAEAERSSPNERQAARVMMAQV
jgi:radical SAM superfamily enzyme YgiQ (UPF0313 family)